MNFKLKKRIFTLLLAAAMLAGMAAVPTYAAEEVILEESFDDYSPNYDVAQTLLPSLFTAEANSIGDGYIQVQENPADGNLHLKSHVFTQIYTTEPVEGAYTFSMDVFQAQGNRQCAIFLRAPQSGTNAYYEADGSEDGNAACRTGIVINCHGTSIDVNVKSFNPKAGATAYFQQNIFTFELPGGVSIGRDTYTTLRVEDNGTEMSIFVADGLVCRIAFSEPNKGGYSRAEVTDPCFRKAVLYGADGAEMATIEDPIVQCQGSTIGWATRVADMIVDNVYLAVDKSTATAPDTDAPTTPDTDDPTTPDTEKQTDAPTTPDTDENTSAPGTDKTTEATTDGATNGATDKETDKPADEGGCASSLGMGAAAVMAATAAAVALRKRQ